MVKQILATLIYSSIIFAIFCPTQSSGVPVAITNIINVLPKTAPLKLSLNETTSRVKAFTFNTSFSSLRTLTMRMQILAKKDYAVILIETTNNLPYCIMENGLLVCCDPMNSRGLACYEGGAPLWLFSTDQNGGINFRCSYVSGRSSGEINLDLLKILQSIPLNKVHASFDSERKILRISSPRSLMNVTFESDTNLSLFGVSRIELQEDQLSLTISGFNFDGRPLNYGAFEFSRKSLEEMGLPIRQLSPEELSSFKIFPKEFPKSGEQENTAKKFKEYLNIHTKQHYGSIPSASNLQSLKEEAEAGGAAAQANLGVMYLKGDGVKQNFTEAAKWLRKAADHGNVQSMYDLGVLYEKGDGVSQSYSKAIEFYHEAAKNDYAAAMVNIGVLYLRGEGVSQSSSNALKWFRQAGAKGLPLGYGYIALMYDRGQGVATNLNEAIKWYRKAAEAGDVWAQTELGVKYSTGNGVVRDDVEAIRWYRKAAELGFAQAQFDLGKMYLNGWGGATNYDEAVKWYRLAANQGDASAERDLGICFILGKGVSKDLIEAYKWLSLATKQGASEAEVSLDLLSQHMSDDAILEGKRLAEAFIPHPITFPNEPQ